MLKWNLKFIQAIPNSQKKNDFYFFVMNETLFEKEDKTWNSDDQTPNDRHSSAFENRAKSLVRQIQVTL